ncbi:7846_t:CDS:2, partial [Paraglomus occultum]
MADTPKIRQLRSYLNLKAKVAVSDGRIFFGTFVCIDKYKNMILAHTDEYRDDEKRFVGLVMIPGKHLVKAEIEDLD